MAEQLPRLRVLRALRAEAAAGQQCDTPFSSPAPVLQPGETAAMVPLPQSSVRKPRYIRREQHPDKNRDPSAFSTVEAHISNV